MNADDIKREYEAGMSSAIAPFVNRPITGHTMLALNATVCQYQEQFLAHHPGYVALAEATAIDLGEGRLNIHAPIGTYAAKLERDHLIAAAEAETELLEQEYLHRQANLARAHRKLMRRHGDNLPRGVASIWWSLSVAQQYVILKDIDYAARHQASDTTSGRPDQK